MIGWPDGRPGFLSFEFLCVWKARRQQAADLLIMRQHIEHNPGLPLLHTRASRRSAVKTFFCTGVEVCSLHRTSSTLTRFFVVPRTLITLSAVACAHAWISMWATSFCSAALMVLKMTVCHAGLTQVLCPPPSSLLPLPLHFRVVTGFVGASTSTPRRASH